MILLSPPRIDRERQLRRIHENRPFELMALSREEHSCGWQVYEMPCAFNRSMQHHLKLGFDSRWCL